MNSSKPVLSPQALLIVGALLLWQIRQVPAFWALIAAYGLAWLVLAYLDRGRKANRPAAGWKVWTILVLVVAGPLLALYADRYDLLWEEGLHGLEANLGDRLRLESLPSIAPPIVFADHPQSLYVHAPQGRILQLELGAGAAPLEAQNLGVGLFRVDYDPRRHGLPETDLATLEATLTVDGKRHRRRLAYVRPAAHPRWLASAPEAGLAAAASEETDEVFILSRDGLERRLAVADGPTDTAFFDGGRKLAVAHRFSPSLWLIDPATGETLKTRDVGPFQVRLAVSPDGSALAVARAGLEPAIDLLALPSFEKTASVPLERAPDWLAFGPSKDVLVYSSRPERSLFRLVREGEAWRQEPALQLGRPAVTLAPSATGETLFVATTDYRPDGEPHRGNHFLQDQILAVAVEPWEVQDRLLTNRRTPRQHRAGNFDQGVSPMGMTARDDGSLLVAFAGTEEVWILPSGLDGSPRVIDGYDLDLVAPHGVADLGEGYWAATSPAGGAMAVYGPGDTLQKFIGVAPPDADLYAAPEGSLDRLTLTLRGGERAFYEGTRAGVSCQSCHLHGSTDHSSHDIGQEPLLPTLTVAGVTGTAPYLRDGSFPQVKDLDSHLARNLYRGYRREMPERGATLQTFVESLPREVNPRRLQALLEPETADPDSERRGAAAFVAARCSLCHTLPAFTNLSRHPTRSLFPEYGAGLSPKVQLDTPSLLGSHGRSHFLQDGRAHDLLDVLEKENPSNRHGDTASLSDQEKRDLVTFLEAL